jgi:hypothetical protein
MISDAEGSTPDPYTALVERCNALTVEWTTFASSLSISAEKDYAAGLPFSAQAAEMSVLALKGCISGLRRAVDEGKV